MSSLRPPLRCAAFVRELFDAPSPVALVHALQGEPFPWLLESALQMPGTGRYSFAGASPYAVLETRGDRSTVRCLRDVRDDLAPEAPLAGGPLEVLRALLPPPPESVAGDDPGALPFLGGTVGYFGYELSEQLEPLGLRRRDDLGLPDQVQLFVDGTFAFDHETGRAFAIGLGFGRDLAVARLRCEEVCEGLVDVAGGVPRSAGRACASPAARVGASRSPFELPAHVEAFFDEASYGEAVLEIGRQIAAGHVYQANLTHRLTHPEVEGSPFALYRALRRANPAPFAAYLDFSDFAVLSSSPERFLGLGADRRIESRPIKGTRPRGANPEEDTLREKELRASEKDRAENLMIVDLVRNDLGRVCEIGSVEVVGLQGIERYATVFQMVSSVAGRLRRDRDALDLLAACFPPGSMTGAPKIAAMRLLDTLEPVRRGIYSGALGYLDVRGGMDLSVVIRTMVVKDGRAYVHVGGGIVADSEPVAEYRETLDKARALLEVLDS